MTEAAALAARHPGRFPDSVFLAAAVFLSGVLYLGGLGFHSDDWFLLSSFGVPDGLSLAQQIDSIAALPARPLQNLTLVLMFRLFGTTPLGYHLTNVLVSIVSVLLFYGILRELRMPRVVTIGVPLVYALLPQYSTVRFWVTGNAPNFSMAAYFLSLYAAVRALRASPRATAGWGAASVAALLVSTLFYEAALPLFFGNMVLVGWLGGLFSRSSAERRRARVAAVLVGVTGLALITIVAYKVIFTDRPMLDIDPLWRAKFVLQSAFSISFVGPNGYGLGLPRTVWRALTEYPDRVRAIATAGFGLGTFFYLRYALRREPNREPTGGFGLRLALAGLFAFLLGIGMAFGTREVGFTKTGLGNRTAIALAPGVALVFVGGVIWLGSLLRRSERRRVAVSIAVSLFAAAGFLVNNTLGSFWTDAVDRQARILEGLKKSLPVMAPGSMVILDGECPYVGPGIVFEAHWDTGGALQLAYADRTLRGDVATRRLDIQDEGLETYIYTPPDPSKPRPQPELSLSHCCPQYRYGEMLFLYDASSGALRQLPDAATARRHLGDGAGRNGRCAGHEGIGAPVL